MSPNITAFTRLLNTKSEGDQIVGSINFHYALKESSATCGDKIINFLVTNYEAIIFHILQLQSNQMLDISHSSLSPVFLALRLDTKRLAHQLTFLFLHGEHALFHGIRHNVLKDKKRFGR